MTTNEQPEKPNKANESITESIAPKAKTPSAPKATRASKTTRAPKAPKSRKKLPKWARITLKISKYLIVPVLCIFAILGGMIIGYVTIGKQDLSDVFQFDTWRHLYDLVFKESVDP